MTLTEIAKMGKAAVIIPSPNVVDNHQYKNAKELADANAAVVICENEINVDGRCRVCETVQSLYEHPEKRLEMGENIRSFAKENVEKTIYEVIVSLLENRK
jgi:UDP-N-acetylglucosamine--N-acetylmuramyl-(pentapeptide) pyrophosphoryl-undecaprenol N-acetylglucosamine transferase